MARIGQCSGGGSGNPTPLIDKANSRHSDHCPTNRPTIAQSVRILDRLSLPSPMVPQVAQQQQGKAGEAWQPIETAPHDQEVRVRVSEMTFMAKLVSDAGMNEDETVCDQWQATREGEYPPCWSEGACYASNADGCASLQPTGWVAVLSSSGTKEGI